MGKIRHKTTIHTTLNVNEEYFSDHAKISKGFNEYFTGVGKQLVATVPDGNRNYAKYLKPLSTTPSFYLTPTDPIEVVQLMNSMKSKKSSGIDGLSMHFLKKIAN